MPGRRQRTSARALHQHLRDLLVQARRREPRRRRVGVVDELARLLLDHLVGQQPRHARVHQGAHVARPQRLRQPLPLLPERLAMAHEQPVAAGVASDPDALVGEHLAHDPPAVIDLAEHVLGLQHDVGQEDLVDVVRAEQRVDRPHLDPGPVHRQQEERQAALARALAAGAGEQHADLGHLRVGGPDLLAVDAPAGAVGAGVGLEAGEVGAGVGLAEALAPDDLALRDTRQVALLLGRRAEAHQRRADPVEPHVLRAARLVVRPHLLAHDGLLPDVPATAAVLARPGEREQVLLAQDPAEALGQREVLRVVGERREEVGREVLGDQLAQSRAEAVSSVPE